MVDIVERLKYKKETELFNKIKDICVKSGRKFLLEDLRYEMSLEGDVFVRDLGDMELHYVELDNRMPYVLIFEDFRNNIVQYNFNGFSVKEGTKYKPLAKYSEEVISRIFRGLK